MSFGPFTPSPWTIRGGVLLGVESTHIGFRLVMSAEDWQKSRPKQAMR
jgi:hypothetical protein